MPWPCPAVGHRNPGPPQPRPMPFLPCSSTWPFTAVGRPAPALPCPWGNQSVVCLAWPCRWHWWRCGNPVSNHPIRHMPVRPTQATITTGAVWSSEQIDRAHPTAPASAAVPAPAQQPPAALLLLSSTATAAAATANSAGRLRHVLT